MIWKITGIRGFIFDHHVVQNSCISVKISLDWEKIRVFASLSSIFHEL